MFSVCLLDFFCTLAGSLRRHLNIEIGESGSVLRRGPLAHLFFRRVVPNIGNVAVFYVHARFLLYPRWVSPKTHQH